MERSPDPGAGPTPPARRWGRLAAVTAAATYFLVVLGGIVRITGSGMGCGPDWPLCNGQLVPTMDLATFIEWAHRLVAGVVGLLVFGVTLRAWWPGAGAAVRRQRTLSAWAAVLLVVQVLLGAVTVRLELPPASVILHAGTAMALLAVLVVGACRALGGRRESRADGASTVGWLTAAGGLAVVLAGVLVANMDAAPACQGFPLCNGQLLPEGGWRIQVHWGHRLLAYGLVPWLLYYPRYVSRQRPADTAARRAALVGAAVAAVQLVVGAVMVLTGLGGELRTLHVALGAGLFAVLTAAATFVAWSPGGAPRAAREG